MKKLNVKKTNENANLPLRAHATDAGLDLFLLEDTNLKPGSATLCPTGVSMEIEPGFMGMIVDRSSMAKKGFKTVGGIIDSDYRGEVKVMIWNLNQTESILLKGERIAQILILPISLCQSVEVYETTETLRGESGFGSTGR